MGVLGVEIWEGISKHKLNVLKYSTHNFFVIDIPKQLFVQKGIVAFLLVCIFLPALSQKDKYYKHVPYFRSLKPENLSRRLTKGLETDSAKVCAIHSWITHKIKYDVKKFYRFDYKHVSVKKILHSRKAVCVGYADLFTELCRYAGINAINVSGYSKNNFVDLNDKLYLSDHEWNAVQIDGRWKLVDATWDAGYIDDYRLTAVGYVIKICTLGKYGISKYKPHFKKSPHETYLLRDGSFFKTDHVASDPSWQLINPKQTIVQFETDSSYYFRKWDISDTMFPDSEGEFNRMNLLTMNGESREIATGFNEYGFNHKNQFSVANSYRLMAEKLFSEIDQETLDTINLQQQCDSVIALVQKSIVHFDSTMFFLNQQKIDLNLNNKYKLQNVRRENAAIISSTKKSLRFMISGVDQSRSNSKRLKLLTRKNDKQLEALHKNRKYSIAKLSDTTKVNDSIMATIRLAILEDSLQMKNSSITQRIQKIQQLNDTCLTRIETYSQKSMRNKEIGFVLLSKRYFMEDDLDYHIRLEKDDFLDHKFKDDSLLHFQDKGFIVRYFSNELKQLRKDMNQLYVHHKSINNECVVFKKSCESGETSRKFYNNNIKEYNKEIDKYNSEIETLHKNIKHVLKACRHQKKSTRKEMRVYIKERSREELNYLIRNRYINDKTNSLRRMCSNRINTASKLEKQSLALKRKFEKK